ncbi:MAG: thiamine pyrophosphate-binding protein [Rhodocyclales bacterium]|nr:thiamine pyrophosphate-binding protein [Rhodocyclales bacterium]
MERSSAFSPAATAARQQPADAADLIVSYLESIGIEYVFGIPGGAVEPLYNALARSQRRGGPRPIVARHESGAAFMADGYARETGKIGVCVATSGPGATNLITGASCAYDNGVPLLIMTGQPALPSFGRRPFQESGCTGINVVGMFGHCTCYSSLVSHCAQVETKLVNALMRANQLQRPVHLSFPVDVMRSPLPPRALPTLAYDLRSRLTKPSLVDELTVNALGAEIRCARRIVFIVGGGCAEAMAPIMELIDLSGALFVCTPDGKGLVNTHHPACRGVFGFAGHSSATAALLSEPDLIVAIGTSMGEWNSSAWSEAVLNDRLVHIDVSEERLMRTPMARLHVQGRILSVCERLVDALRTDAGGAAPDRGRVAPAADPAPTVPDAAAGADDAPIEPQHLMAELSRRCPPATRYLADTGNSTAWAVHCLQRQNRRLDSRPLPAGRHDAGAGEERSADAVWLRVTMDFAPMGWAIGAAVGVARGNPGSGPVVCITGDGSYLMNGQEITVAASEQLCVLFVVLNDGALGMVKHGQRLTGAEAIAFELPQVDFRLMAQAMGVPGHVVATAADLAALDFDAIFRRRGPTLLDVRVNPEAVPPLNVRIKSLTQSA